MVRLAANISMLFGEVPLVERYATAARWGFDGVECTFVHGEDADALGAARRAAGVEHVLLNAPAGDMAAGDRGLAADAARSDEFDASVETAARYARILECRRVHVMSGVVPRGVDRAGAESTVVASLTRAAERLADDGVVLMVEALNDRDAPGYVVDGLAVAVRTVEAIGRPNVAVQFDTYHLQIMGGDLTARFDAHSGVIGHVQISSVPGRTEPDRGEVDHGYFLGHLDAVGYDGWVGCEYRPRGTSADGLPWAAPYGIGLNRTPGTGGEPQSRIPDST